MLVLSDLHLGKGKFLSNGQLNILEDFFEDERFAEILEYYSSGDFLSSPVHLFLNGDILNLIQIDVDGAFTHIIDVEHTINAIRAIAKGHPKFFDAIRLFLKKPNKQITYVIGNHDAGMAFEGAQKYFNKIVEGEVHFTFFYQEFGIHIEHGHRFEVINTVPPKDYFKVGPNNKKILNLPWGSLFCISLLPILKKDRPLIDKVRPLSAYVKWLIFHDFGYYLKLSLAIIKYILQTNTSSYTKQNSNFKTNMKLLKQITIYPRYEKMAKRILRKNPSLKIVVMGHTHVQEWRKFPEGKLYFNSGTWNHIPIIDVAMHPDTSKLTYILIDINEKTEIIKDAQLNLWMGDWRPYRIEVNTT